MTVKVIQDTQDFITHQFIAEGTYITRVSDYGKDMYSGVMGEFGVLVPMDDCAILLEDLHE